MTFQSFTTQEQSIQLKQLGFPQFDNGLVPRYSEDGTRYVAEDGEGDDDPRILSRGVIEDYLMERYTVTIVSGIDIETGHPMTMVSLRGNDRRKNDGGGGMSFRGSVNDRDPFTALYDALCWALKHERGAAGDAVPPPTSPTTA